MLRTTCNNCKFKLNPSGCDLLKTIVLGLEGQYIDGFCRNKRPIDWIGNIDDINKEELALSVIVLDFNNNIDKLKITLNSVAQYNLVRQVIVIVKNASKSFMKELLDEILRLKIPWSLENLTTDQEPDYLASIDYCSELIKNNWFIALKSGEELDENIITSFKENILNKDTNIVALYYDLKDNYKVVVNKFAFRDLKGNIDIPWFEKIQSFDKWEQFCYQIK